MSSKLPEEFQRVSIVFWGKSVYIFIEAVSGSIIIEKVGEVSNQIPLRLNPLILWEPMLAVHKEDRTEQGQ